MIIICVLTIRATQFLADLFADIARLIFSNFTGIVSKVVVLVEAIAETFRGPSFLRTFADIVKLFQKGFSEICKMDNVKKRNFI